MNKLLIVVVILSLFLTGCIEQSVIFSTFEIVPSGIRDCDYDENRKQFSVVVREDNNEIIDYKPPILNFRITPDIPAGSSTEDYVTIFFELEYDQGKFFQDSQGVRQIKWSSGNDIWKISGSKKFPIISTLDLNLELNLNINQVLEEGETFVRIIFHDEQDLWRDSYDVLLKGIRT